MPSDAPKIEQRHLDAAEKHYPPALWRREAREDLAQFLAQYEADHMQPQGGYAELVERVALAILNEKRRFQGLQPMSKLSEMPPHQYRDERRHARAAINAMRGDHMAGEGV